MAARDARRELALRRILEGVIVTVTSGLILWSVTSSMSQPGPSTPPIVVAMAPTTEPAAPPPIPSFVAPAGSEERVPLMASPWPAPGLLSAAAQAPPPPRSTAGGGAADPGPILLYEDFSAYRDGDAPGWGAGTFVKTGLDHRHWLVTNADGSHPVGCRIRLPGAFSFECRYSAYLPEVTRGILGWWKEPVSTTIALLDDRGGRCVVEWVIKYGNDPTQINPVGSPSVFARKYYHTIRLPDGSSNEVGVVPASGLLRIDVNHHAVSVLIDGQPVAAGSINPAGQLVGFEVNLIKDAGGMLFFTEFKIAR
jgi:hypothetical protein